MSAEARRALFGKGRDALGVIGRETQLALEVAFDVELLYRAQRAGLLLREVPVRWNHSEGSKIEFVRDSLRMLREVSALRRTVRAEGAA